MNKYVTPNLELIKLMVQDIIMASTESGGVVEDETVPVPGNKNKSIV